MILLMKQMWFMKYYEIHVFTFQTYFKKLFINVHEISLKVVHVIKKYYFQSGRTCWISEVVNSEHIHVEFITVGCAMKAGRIEKALPKLGRLKQSAAAFDESRGCWLRGTQPL